MNSIKRIQDANYVNLLRFELVDTGGVSSTARAPRNENVFLASCDGHFANTHCSRHMKLCFYRNCATVNFSHILCGKVNNPCF
jgi:hypothetical protein